MLGSSHFRRILIIWVVVSIVLTLLAVLVAAPKLPPGKLSGEGSGEVDDNAVLIGIGTPIFVFIVVYFAYTMIVFRRRKGEAQEEGPAVRGDNRVQLIWLGVTTAIVIFATTFGTIRLAEAGAGGGQGANPVWKPSGSAMPVQVIGQQWAWTFRFPTYGGVETPHLELPVGKDIAFHVTSLDVIHSFWAKELAVKADANPGVDNVAFVHPNNTGTFVIRCAELCGLWHGHMFDTGKVVSDAQFAAWIRGQQRQFAPATKNLKPYNKQYFPSPQRRAG